MNGRPLTIMRKPNLLPNKDNENIRRIISMLNIKNEPFYVDVIPDPIFENGNCFPNVMGKVNEEKGKIIYGWQFCEYDYMIEAEFHAIWESPVGKLIDITPGHTSVVKSLFVIDPNRKFEGIRIENVMLNVTENKLVDDIIDNEKARFHFMNKVELLDPKYWEIENIINNYAVFLEQSYFEGCSHLTKCFCNSGIVYDQCCRNIFKDFIFSILEQ
jgi:hypothetical protein